MDDMGDYWRGMAEASKHKRAANRANSADLLRQAGVEFESKNGGAHLVVYGVDRTFDFWPGTGLWVVRHSSDKRRGVRGLIKKAKGAN